MIWYGTSSFLLELLCFVFPFQKKKYIEWSPSAIKPILLSIFGYIYSHRTKLTLTRWSADWRGATELYEQAGLVILFLVFLYWQILCFRFLFVFFCFYPEKLIYRRFGDYRYYKHWDSVITKWELILLLFFALFIDEQQQMASGHQANMKKLKWLSRKLPKDKRCNLRILNYPLSDDYCYMLLLVIFVVYIDHHI